MHDTAAPGTYRYTRHAAFDATTDRPPADLRYGMLEAAMPRKARAKNKKRNRPSRPAKSAPTAMDHDFREAYTAFKKGNMYGAEAACRRVLKQNKKHVDALHLMAEIMTVHDRFTEAYEYFKKCAAIRPREAGLYVSLANVSFTQGRTEDALVELEKALKLRPGYPAAVMDKAFVLDRLGRYDEARESLKGLLVPAELVPKAALCRATIEHNDKKYEQAIAVAQPFVNDDATPPDTRMMLAYLQGSAYDKLGDPDRAMAAWKIANNAVRTPFDRHEYRNAVDQTIKFFSRRLAEILPRSSIRSAVPIFIAGMPRSGTTLIEQIIHRHPQAFGAGELVDIEVFRNTLQTRMESIDPYPRCLRNLTTEMADKLATEYLDHVAELSGGADRVVNKHLDNIKNLGLIALLFPRARVITNRRDPVDNCLSIYMNRFHPIKHAYSTDLGHIGFVYKQSQRLLQHWREVLDLPMLDIDYEQLVADQERFSRAIIDFCGLEWDDACLQFHRSKRSVMTLSYAQVSKPMYTSAVARWKKYEAHLGPLLAELENDS